MAGTSRNLSAGWVVPVFLLIVFTLPIALAPALYFAFAGHFPFHRMMARALLVSALIAIWIFRSRLKLRAWWPAEGAWLNLGIGVGIAVVSAQAMIGAYLAACGFHGSGVSPIKPIIGATVAALIVPLLEETIFRGFVLTALAESIGRRAGWILAAFIYAIAHFLRVPQDSAPVHWWSGVTGMAAIFAGLFHGDFLTGRFANLFIVGLILGGVFLRLGKLWLSAGLHGGWILILMIFSALTRPDMPLRFAWLGTDLLGSPITSAVLLMLGGFLWRFCPPPAPEVAVDGGS